MVEAKKQGATLTGVETQSGRYAQGLPASLPAWHRPLPFLYESTGIETHFTQGLDPAPRARNVFAFHQPALLAEWLKVLLPLPLGEGWGEGAQAINEPPAKYLPPQTFQARLQQMPELVTEWGDFKLWPAQITAIRNLEKSLAANKPRALIQMATGSGKAFTAIGFIYRLIKFAGVTRKLWIYDLRTNKHFTLKTNPLKREDLDEFVRLYNPANRFDRAPTWSAENPEGRWRGYEVDELMARDKASLDIFWLRDETLADSDNLPPPDVIAQEIVDDLEAALEQFRLIATDLGSPT